MQTVDTRQMRSFVSSTKEREVPSKSPAQRRTMRAAAHNPAFAKKVGVPQDVAREFAQADRQKKRKTTPVSSAGKTVGRAMRKSAQRASQGRSLARRKATEYSSASGRMIDKLRGK